MPQQFCAINQVLWQNLSTCTPQTITHSPLRERQSAQQTSKQSLPRG